MRAIGHLVESVGEPFAIFEYTRTNSSTEFAPNLSASKCLSFRISREADLDKVQWRRLRDGREYVDLDSSPVIEVIRPFFDGNDMSQGRFYGDVRNRV